MAFLPVAGLKEQHGYYRPGLSPWGKEFVMSELKKRTFFQTVGLQFFAEKGGEGDQNKGDPDGSRDEDKGGTGGQSGKTFTQEEVNRLMKAEKESAKKALLKEIGVEDAKSAKEGLAEYKKILDKDKTEAQKAQESLGTETKARKEAEARAALAEAKVEVLSAGCKADYLEDVITLALSRVTNDKNLQVIVKEMKKDPKYATFFGEGGSGSYDRGTGGGSGYHRGGSGDKAGSLGARLGAQVTSSNSSKNPYFNN